VRQPTRPAPVRLVRRPRRAESLKSLRMPWLSFLAVGSGAALGAWLRWALGLLLNSVFPTLPLGTLAAKLLGGFIIGVAMTVAEPLGFPPAVRLLITTGFLGGLITFSTFSAETTTLLMRAQNAWAAAAASMRKQWECTAARRFAPSKVSAGTACFTPSIFSSWPAE
jgi:CrcB protein